MSKAVFAAAMRTSLKRVWPVVTELDTHSAAEFQRAFAERFARPDMCARLLKDLDSRRIVGRRYFLGSSKIEGNLCIGQLVGTQVGQRVQGTVAWGPHEGPTGLTVEGPTDRPVGHLIMMDEGDAMARVSSESHEIGLFLTQNGVLLRLTPAD